MSESTVPKLVPVISIKFFITGLAMVGLIPEIVGIPVSEY
jgi:hypothetical protein